MAKAGRKLKLTPVFIKEAEKLLKAGNYANTVADYLNISESTWYEWLKLGEKAQSGIYRDFWETIKKATAIAEVGAVSGILQAAQDGNWQAFAWFLERKFPNRWGRKDRNEMPDPQGQEQKSGIEQLADSLKQLASATLVKNTNSGDNESRDLYEDETQEQEFQTV
jgi:hypothetical protein